MHTGLGGHTVDDVEWVVVVKGTDTTNSNRSSARRITIGLNVHTRYTSLQGLHRVVLVLLRHFIDADHRDGTRQVCLALNGITSYYKFFEHLGIFGKGNSHSILGRHFNCLVSHIRDNQRLAGVNLQGEVSVEIGNRTVRCTFLQYRGTNDCFTQVIENGALDFTLRVHYSTCQKNQRTEKKFL